MKASDNLNSSYCRFAEKKKALQIALQKEVNGNLTHISLRKSSSNLFRKRTQEKKTHKLDVAAFNQVLSIDVKQMTADVEGMTTYEALVNATLEKEMLPYVVPELKTITIGGAAAGLGIESSSFCYGLMHESIVEMEIILEDGRILICTAENENRDLFFAFPNSYGSLGYALRVKIRLLLCKKAVKLTHQKFSNSIAYFESLKAICLENRKGTDRGNVAFVDGVIFAANEMYITTGEFIENSADVSSYTYMHMYYRSIASKSEDFLVTADYIWRWDADWFWCSKVFGMENRVCRFLLGKWLLHSKVYTKMMRFFHRHPLLEKFISGTQKQEWIIQDVLIPIERADEFLSFLQKNIPITPIWICPTQSPPNRQSFSLCPLDGEILYVDFGLWGPIPSAQSIGYYNRMIESKVMELGGLKSLYSSCYYTEEEFWSIYDSELYASLKAKYDPKHKLRSLYAKCCSK